MKKGFTIVEILIVVAIVAILAAIAIPNLLRSRLNANEHYAISNLQTISVAAQTYQSTKNNFPATLKQLNDETLIDNVLGCSLGTCLKNGYKYTIGGTGQTTDFFIYAVPETTNVTGVRSFCSGADGVVRANSSGIAPGSQDACNSWDAI